MNPLYAEIIIPLALPKNYTWSVPESLQDKAQRGCRAEVALKNKKYAGVIKRLFRESPGNFKPKEILNLLDTEPVVYPQQLALWEWISSYYLCTEGEVMAAALPGHFKLSSETILAFNDEFGEDFSGLDHDEFLVAEALRIKKQLKLAEVQQILESTRVYPVLKGLLEKNVCQVWEALRERYKVKQETYVRLNPRLAGEEELSRLLNEDPKLQRAGKQMELLLSYLHLLRSEGEVSRKDLLAKSGASDAQLKGLLDKEILQLEKRNTERLPPLPKEILLDFELTPAQEQANREVESSFGVKPVCLLHGITSSGKTRIYIKQMERTIRAGKQVLYLLPEIALTAQIIRRLQAHFGGHIGIYHSKFNQNERLEIWNRVRSGQVQIILGARSALFLPFMDLGLVIVDEEHDSSYKQQEPAPRYNARDAAIYFAALFGARVLAGSATPSVESFYNARQGKYGLVDLNERYGGLELPEIEVADTRGMLSPERTKIILSARLRELMDSALASGSQVILFQNRRGYSPYQICRVCGWIPHCANCNVSLNYHKLTDKLHCHYCGTIYPLVIHCGQCGSHDFAQKNFGTERIEERLQELFPACRVARMDMDSVRGKHAHDLLIRSFEQRQIDVLVGTQMVVKGLDFDHVSLVGVLDADSLLNFADFRVNERAFQLMEQVSGRAGRKEGRGRVLIQAVQANHPVLAFVRNHDYASFFEREMRDRQQFFYPPLSRIVMVHFRHKQQEVVSDAARLFANFLTRDFGKFLSGPAEPVINRIRGQYLMELMLKLPKDSQTLSFAKHCIHQQTAILQSEKKFRSVTIIPDVDPI
jgi:primosomal protein N' (replication factor Y)